MEGYDSSADSHIVSLPYGDEGKTELQHNCARADFLHSSDKLQKGKNILSLMLRYAYRCASPEISFTFLLLSSGN